MQRPNGIAFGCLYDVLLAGSNLSPVDDVHLRCHLRSRDHNLILARIVIERLDLEDFAVTLNQAFAGDGDVRAEIHLEDNGVVGIQGTLTECLGAFVEFVR